MIQRLFRVRPWVRWGLGLAAFAAIVTTIDVVQAMAQFAFQGRPPLSALRLWGLGWLEWLVRGSLIPLGVADQVAEATLELERFTNRQGIDTWLPCL